MLRAARLVPIVIATVAVTACASTGQDAGLARPGPESVVTETSTSAHVRIQVEGPATSTVEADAERVLALLPQVFDALGVEIDVNDPDARAVGVLKFTKRRIAGEPTERLVRCGNDGAGPSAMSVYRIQLSVLTRVQPMAGGMTAVQTEVRGDAMPVDGSSSARTLCVSNGRIEQMILERLRAGLAP